MTEKTSFKKQTTAQPAVASSEALIEKYRTPFLVGLAVLVLAVGGWFAYSQYSKSQDAKAAEAMFKGQQYFEADNYEKALNGDGQGYTGFIAIADEFGSTASGNLAQLYASICYANLGKWQEAAERLEKFSGCDDAMVSPSALAMLGNTYAQLEQPEKAAETLLKAAKKADSNSLSPVFLIQAGELFESLGQNDKALKCYQLIKDTYNQSMAAADIDKYIERATK